MCHVGWKSSTTASYYMKLADVLRAGAPADALSSTSLPVTESSKTYKDYNQLKNFVLAFPPSSQPSLKRPVSSVSSE